jgi:FKBP-type peptidyl-prolyl cis-trans isomerase FkpA
MKKSMFILGLAMLGLTACQQFQDGEGGMQYKIITDNGQPKIQEGDFVSIGAIIKTDSDSLLMSTYETGQPTYMTAQAPMYPGDITSALLKLGSGDSAIFKFNIDSMVARGLPKPEDINSKYLVYTFKINHVIPKGELTDSVFQAQIEEYIVAEEEKIKNAESGIIDNYIKQESLTAQTTPSGLRYVIETEGTGPLAKVGDSITVNYTGHFITGSKKVFDTSIEEVAKKEGGNVYNPQRPYEPITIPVGLGAVIPGWDEAMQLLPEGTKAKLIVPSKLAYGEQGAMGAIAPYTPLAFEIEVVKVTPQKAETPTN